MHLINAHVQKSTCPHRRSIRIILPDDFVSSVVVHGREYHSVHSRFVNTYLCIRYKRFCFGYICIYNIYCLLPPTAAAARFILVFRYTSSWYSCERSGAKYLALQMMLRIIPSLLWISEFHSPKTRDEHGKYEYQIIYGIRHRQSTFEEMVYFVVCVCNTDKVFLFGLKCSRFYEYYLYHE